MRKAKIPQNCEELEVLVNITYIKIINQILRKYLRKVKAQAELSRLRKKTIKMGKQTRHKKQSRTKTDH